MIERHYSLSSAAKVIGVTRETLKKWLAEDAFVLPGISGKKVLIRESDLEMVLRRRRLAPNPALVRGTKRIAS